MADNLFKKPGIGRGLSDGVVVALSEHRQNERGYCWKDGERWPCLTDQLRVAREWAALWKRAAKAKHGDWNDAMGYWYASAEAYAAERSARAALVAALDLAHQVLLAYRFPAGQTPEELDQEASTAIKVITRALLDQPTGRAAAPVDQCTRALDCTQRAGHDGWCTVVLISEGRRCQAKEGRAKCWRPVGHDGVHEDRALRWPAARQEVSGDE